jgi:hypothetical protein
VELVVPVTGFFLEQRLELANAGLAKVEDIHGRAVLSFMIADSASGARNAATCMESRRLLLHATQPGELRNERKRRRAMIINI